MTRRRTEDTREAFGWLAVMMLFFVAYQCAGCGASAIQTHARAAGIAVVALRGADDMAERAALVAIEACQDEPCIAAVEHATEVSDAAIASVAATLTAYVEGIQLAQVAGESAPLISALITAGLRLVEEWDRLRAALAPLGVEIPGLPGGGS